MEENIDNIIQNCSTQKKELADVLFSTTNIITKIHSLRSMMIDSISDPQYLSMLTPEQWVLISEALTNAESVSGEYINTQAKIAEKIPSVQNVYMQLAGNSSGGAPKQLEEQSSYQIPEEILPIQQAVQSTMDSRFGIDRTKILDEYGNNLNVEKEDNREEN